MNKDDEAELKKLMMKLLSKTVKPGMTVAPNQEVVDGIVDLFKDSCTDEWNGGYDKGYCDGKMDCNAIVSESSDKPW